MLMNQHTGSGELYDLLAATLLAVNTPQQWGTTAVPLHRPRRPPCLTGDAAGGQPRALGWAVVVHRMPWQCMYMGLLLHIMFSPGGNTGYPQLCRDSAVHSKNAKERTS